MAKYIFTLSERIWAGSIGFFMPIIIVAIIVLNLLIVGKTFSYFDLPDGDWLFTWLTTLLLLLSEFLGILFFSEPSEILDNKNPEVKTRKKYTRKTTDNTNVIEQKKRWTKTNSSSSFKGV